MKNKPDMSDWLEISGLLLRQLLPAGDAMQWFGHGIPAEALAMLIDRAAMKVDHALVAMALASGEQEVKAIVGQLDREVLIGLFSRWAHYTERWRVQQEPHWVPPKSSDIWRAVFLSMAAGSHAQAAAKQLWPQDWA